jgi:hypothetical protein
MQESLSNAESPKPLAFVIMPFDPDFNSVYEQLVKPALQEAGYDVARADSLLDQQNILASIVRSIHSADLIVAELTNLNANVMYELGVCHTLARPTILLTQSISDLPFDLRSYVTHEYSTNFVEALELKNKLNHIATEARLGKVRFSNPVTDYLPKSTASAPLVDIHSQTAVQLISADVDDRGFIDLMTDAEADAKKMVDLMTVMTDETTKNSATVEEYGARISALNQSPGSGTTTQVQRIAQLTAYELNNFSSRVEALQTDYDQAVDHFIGTTDRYIAWYRSNTHGGNEREAEFKETLNQFVVATTSTLNSTTEYKQSVGSIKGINRELTRAATRLETILTKWISTYQKLVAFANRAVMVFEQ